MIITPPNWIVVNRWLSIGCLTACGQCRADIAIHVWRDDFSEKCSQKGYPSDISINYRDGEDLTPEIKTVLDGVAWRIKRERVTVLVHCHAGQTRSPSIGAYLLSKVDGVDIFKAIETVSRCLWEQRGLPINIGHKFLRSVAPS